jgi:hypothetical protein
MRFSMRKEHIDSVVKMHLESWAPYEISVKLGKRYLEAFYNSIVINKNSFGYVFVHEGDIIAYAVGFSNYPTFGQNFQRQNVFSLSYCCLAAFLKLRLNIFDVLNILADNQKLDLLENPEYHLGALAVQKNFMGTAVGRRAVLESISAVIDHLQNAGYPSCWGCCDARNIPMQKVLVKRFGFENKGVHKQKGRKTLMYEKYFTNGA